jgi:molybdopterin-synthase adenylyltransferase
VTPDELTRYARHIVLREFGGTAQAQLGRATVAVVGTGGIGAPALLYLAAAGVGRLLLIDDDRVDASNLQRQVIFATADAGSPKVDAAAATLASLNPHVAVETQAERLDPGNAERLLAGADAVLDGSDSFATRLAVSDATLALRVPLISASVAQFEGQLATYRGWEPTLPCYRCLVGDAPDRPEESCSEAGVLGPAAGVLGTLAATEAIRAVAPFGEDQAGRLLLVDLLAMRFRTVRMPKDPGCRCGLSYTPTER